MSDKRYNTFIVCPIAMRTRPLELAQVVTNKGTHEARGLFAVDGVTQTPEQFYPSANVSRDGLEFWFKGEFSLEELKALDAISGVKTYTHKIFETEILTSAEWAAPEEHRPASSGK
jgi:hypothetical protein